MGCNWQAAPVAEIGPTDVRWSLFRGGAHCEESKMRQRAGLDGDATGLEHGRSLHAPKVAALAECSTTDWQEAAEAVCLGRKPRVLARRTAPYPGRNGWAGDARVATEGSEFGSCLT